MFSFDADPNGMAGLAGINSEPTDLPQVGANQPPMPGASDGVALRALVPESYDNIVLAPEQPVDYGGGPAETALGAVAEPLTGSGEASDRFAVLSDALALGYEQLKQFAGSPDLLTEMGLAFGNDLNAEVAGYLADNWSNGTMDGPPIEVVSATEIDWADAAFAGATKTIYISEELLARGSENAEVVANAWLEEYGHYVDSLVNVTDAPGDEGAIFSAVVRGESLSQERLDALRVESDRAFVVIDGMEVEIEKAISSDLERQWKIKLYYKDDPNGAWKRLSQTKDGKQVNLFTGSRKKDGLDTLWPKDGKPAIVPSNDYFAFEAYTIENFDRGQVYEFNVKADDQYRIRAYPLKSVSGGYDAADGGNWEYISGYDINSEGKKTNTWREKDTTLPFVLDRSGPYLVYAGYIETEGDSFFNLSWDKAETRGSSVFGEAERLEVSTALLGSSGPARFKTPIEIKSIDNQPITDRPTWLITHGNANSAENMKYLASAIKSNNPDYQVLTLDWSSAANQAPNSWNSGLDLSTPWIKPVAREATNLIDDLGISRQNLNLIGHSLGAYVSWEIADLTSGGVNNLVALDPARQVWGGYPTGNINFRDRSDWAWGFFGEPTDSSLTNPTRGGDLKAETAEESFYITFPSNVDSGEAHGAVVEVFANMLTGKGSGSQYFDLSNMGNTRNWNIQDENFEGEIKAVKTSDGWVSSQVFESDRSV